MSPRFKKIAIPILSLIWVLTVSIGLAIAIGNALRLFSLRREAPEAGVTTFSGFRPGIPAEFLIGLVLVILLFLAVHHQPQRILPLSLMAIVTFFAFNLFAGRHVLPVDLIPPRVSRLSTAYAQAVSRADQPAALALSGPSNNCQEKTRAMFAAHRESLESALGPGVELADFELDMGRVETFSGPSPPDALGMTRPISQQRVAITMASEGQDLLTMTLRFVYAPGFGRRAICGSE